MLRAVSFVCLIVTACVTLSAQSEPRGPLTPAETLLAPAVLSEISSATSQGYPPEPNIDPLTPIAGTEPNAGGIALVCNEARCEAAIKTIQVLRLLTRSKAIAAPSRTIQLVHADSNPPQNLKAAIYLVQGPTNTVHVVRGFWSTVGVADEVVEIFAAVSGPESLKSKEKPRWDSYGIPTTTIVAAEGADGDRQAAFVAAASAYFLATLPNAGAEALLSHLIVGAHARLAEDGRKAVAMMGSQQRASGEVLIMFAQAIEREQRRILSFERFVPAPVDPVLHERLFDMSKSITGVWASMGLTPAPFVPAAERIRGRGGEDRRVPSKVRPGPLPTPERPTAFLKFPNVADVIYELGNLIDGKRSISDIRDILSAEFGTVALPVVSDYFDRLAAAGAVTLK